MLLERGKKSEFSLELSLELSIKFSFFHGVLTGRGMKEKSQISSIKIKKVINSVGWGGVYFFFTVTGKGLCLGLVPNAELVVQGCVSPC